MKVVFVSLRACSLPRSTCRSFRNTFSRKKVTIDGLNTISNGELHVSDPLCDNENKDLTLVILTWKKTTVYLFLQSITCMTTECLFWKRQIYSEKVFGEGFSLQKIQINKLYYGSKKYKIKKKTTTIYQKCMSKTVEVNLLLRKKNVVHESSHISEPIL